jgi:OFA family oxalate/formate antiporter-like MFS transporter
LANILASRTGGWQSVFVIAAVLNAVAALMALIVLKPKRKSFLSTVGRSRAPAHGQAGRQRVLKNYLAPAL